MAVEVPPTFFSYCREDSEFALRLAEDLKSAGAAIWIDQLDIAGGQRWARAVQDALTAAPRLLVVLSPNAVSSTNVDDEVNFALDERKPVIPVLYQTCTVPFRMRALHYIDFRTDYAPALQSLLKSLGVPQKDRTRRRSFPLLTAQKSANASDAAVDERQRLLRIEEELRRRVVGQDEPISALARVIRRAYAGLNSPNRPIASFLFLGPSGVGKKEVARTLADFLFGGDQALIRFDMSDFMERHSVSKLIGAPPGYVGYEEGGQLTEQVKRAPNSVLLLDGIEKAHPDLLSLLQRVLDEGEMIDSQGRTIDFRNTILIMTSHIGSRELARPQSFQFKPEDVDPRRAEEKVKTEAKRALGPTFLNALDEILIFHGLTREAAVEIMQVMVQQMNLRLHEHSVSVTVTKEARSWILRQGQIDLTDGAPSLRRALQKYVENPLSELLLQGSIAPKPADLEVYDDGERLLLRRLDEAGSNPILLYAG